MDNKPSETGDSGAKADAPNAANIADAATDKASAAVDTAKETVSNAVDKAKEMLTSVPVPESIKEHSSIILMLLGGVIAAFLLAGVLYYIVTRTMKRTTTVIIPETRKPILCTSLTKGDGSKLNDGADGKRVTVSFWIYINDLNTNMGQIRRVFNRGSKDMASIDKSSPFVCINDKSNKIHVIFTSTEASQYMQNGVDKSTLFVNSSTVEKVYYLSAAHGITIDYVPMQRWVHVAVVVNEESSAGVVKAYIDGELVKTVTTSATIKVDGANGSAAPVTNVKLELASLDLRMKGDVYIGGDSSSVPGFSGLVSQIGFTNSDLNDKDIYSMYIRGPLDGTVGFAGYGIQSPIYRIT